MCANLLIFYVELSSYSLFNSSMRKCVVSNKLCYVGAARLMVRLGQGMDNDAINSKKGTKWKPGDDLTLQIEGHACHSCSCSRFDA